MRRLLHALFTPTTDTAAAGDIEAARSQLISAKEVRAQRVAALAEAKQHLERVHQVIEQAKAADIELAAAESQAAAASRAWAEAGATGLPDASAF